MTGFIILKSGIMAYVYLFVFLLTVILGYFVKREQKKIVAEGRSERAKLRKTWTRIPIEYDELEIKSNCWKQEIVVGSGTDSRNEYVDVNQNVLLLNKSIGNNNFNIEIMVEMVPEILRMKIAIQKELSLYYNPNNPDEVFLDLEFLFN